MGHERVGALPHSKQWREVIAQMTESSGSPEEVAVIASDTLQNVRTQFNGIHNDDGVVAAFQFLIALTKSASHRDHGDAAFSPGIDLERSPSPLRLIAELRSWVEAQGGSREYADIAAKASADAIAYWSSQQSMQGNLFANPDDAGEIWRRADNGAGFCEVSRLFFSKFTERYLNFFLEREASASATSFSDRDRLAAQLREHIDDVSKFAFETSRITQSFAAGWFNNHARDRYPTKDESRGFLSVAFGKMREELRRESGTDG